MPEELCQVFPKSHCTVEMQSDPSPWTPTGLFFNNIGDPVVHMGDRPLQVAWERTPGWIPMECCSTCSEEPSIRSNDWFSTLERGSSFRWEVFPLKVSDWNGASKTTKTMTFADCGSECRANLIKDKSCHGVKWGDKSFRGVTFCPCT